MRKRVFIILVVLALALGTAGFSRASYTFNMGPDSLVDTTGTNPYLQMQATVNPNLNDILYTLEEGESYSFNFARFFTEEGWINSDDIHPGNLTAHVDFDNPDLIPAIGGTSVGFSAWWDFVQGWNLTWNDPVVVPFGNGGQFTIELEDVAYASWFWQGPDGSGCHPGYADVHATVTLNSSPVPLPGSLVFLASGLFGLIGLRKGRVLIPLVVKNTKKIIPSAYCFGFFEDVKEV